MTAFDETNTSEEIGLILPEEDDGAEVRIEKVMKLTDRSALLDIVKNDKNDEVRLTALNKLVDRAAIADIARNNSSPEVREAAVLRTEDQAVLSDIGKNDLSKKVRLAAVNKLADENVLTEIAVSDRSLEESKAAASKVSDRDLMRKIATESAHKNKLIVPAVKGPFVFRAGSRVIASPRKSTSALVIIRIIIDVIMIVGGLSGTLVLKWTNSSLALVVIGIGLLIWHITKIGTGNVDTDLLNSHLAEIYQKERFLLTAQNASHAPVNVVVSLKRFGKHGGLDFGARLNGTKMKHSKKNMSFTLSTDRTRNILTFNNLDLVVVFDIDDTNSSEKVLELFVYDKFIGVILPEGVTLIRNV